MSAAQSVHSQSIINGQPDLQDDSHPQVGALLVWRGAAGPGAAAHTSICGATLVAKDIILTAAHCLVGHHDLGATVRMYFTRSPDVTQWRLDPAASPPGAVLVRRAVPHPGFVPVPPGGSVGLGRLNDIGLGFLAEPIHGVTPQRLIAPEHVVELRRHAKVTILGYGATRSGYEANAPQAIASMGVRRRAQSYLQGLGPFEMQVGGSDPASRRCHGDSGGPTLLLPVGMAPGNEELIGVGSHTYDEHRCFHGHVDTRVDRYLSWIHGHIARARRP